MVNMQMCWWWNRRWQLRQVKPPKLKINHTKQSPYMLFSQDWYITASLHKPKGLLSPGNAGKGECSLEGGRDVSRKVTVSFCCRWTLWNRYCNTFLREFGSTLEVIRELLFCLCFVRNITTDTWFLGSSFPIPTSIFPFYWASSFLWKEILGFMGVAHSSLNQQAVVTKREILKF